MKSSQTVKELAAALVRVQKALKPAVKDSTNLHFNRKYADLSAVWDACRGPLNANDITALQDVTSDERGVSVCTILIHTSGEWIEFGPLTVPLTKMSAHEVGSATSYGKRYALAAAVGIVAEEDDDGNAAVASARPQAEEGERKSGEVMPMCPGCDLNTKVIVSRYPGKKYYSLCCKKKFGPSNSPAEEPGAAEAAELFTDGVPA